MDTPKFFDQDRDLRGCLGRREPFDSAPKQQSPQRAFGVKRYALERYAGEFHHSPRGQLTRLLQIPSSKRHFRTKSKIKAYTSTEDVRLW
jgi:hypothetical protein